MASRIGKRLLAGIFIGLILGGALGIFISTPRIGELERRIEELEAIGPDVDALALQERILSLMEQLEGNLTLIDSLAAENQDLSETVESLQMLLEEEGGGEAPIEIPQGPFLVNSRPSLEGVVGEAMTLDPASLFRIAEAAEYHWEQVFPERYSLEYLTNHPGTLSDASASNPTFVPEKPGNFRFRLTATDSEGHPNVNEVDVWVTKEEARSLEIEGAIFADLFEWLGSDEFNLNPGTDAGRAQVLDHAMGGPARVGANWVGLVSAAFYTQVSPVPVLEDWGNDLSLTDQEHYAAIVNAAKRRGLKVMHTESAGPGLDLTQEDLETLEEMKEDPDWWDAWYDVWEGWLIPRAERAERYGVDMYVIGLFVEETFRPDVYPRYGERWRELIGKVREVYSGRIGIDLINADERLTFADALDDLLITVFPGLYTSRDTIEDLSNPTLEEVVEITEDMLYWPREMFAGDVDVSYVVAFVSADQQLSGEEPEIIFSRFARVDFQEQTLYYEGFMEAFEDEEWVTGLFTERWDWFDQFRREGEDYDTLYYDATTEASPRSKPAEQVIRLWNGIFSPDQ